MRTKQKSGIESPPPPATLSERSKQLWAEAIRKKVKTPQRQIVLEGALQALDLADECRTTILADGLTCKSKRSGLMRRHPLLQTEADARRQFLKMWRELGLASSGNSIWADDDDEEQDGE